MTSRFPLVARLWLRAIVAAVCIAAAAVGQEAETYEI